MRRVDGLSSGLFYLPPVRFKDPGVCKEGDQVKMIVHECLEPLVSQHDRLLSLRALVQSQLLILSHLLELATKSFDVSLKVGSDNVNQGLCVEILVGVSSFPLDHILLDLKFNFHFSPDRTH